MCIFLVLLQAMVGWAIALHGGGGDIPIDLPDELRIPRETALRHCLDLGVSALKSGKHPLDVTELVVRLSPSLPLTDSFVIQFIV